MAKGKKTKKNDDKVKVVTPIGRLSYPWLVTPDSGRQYSDDKFKTDLLIDKNTWKKDGAALKEALVKVARIHFKNKNIQLKDFENPLKDTNKLEKYSTADAVKDHILVRAKSDFPPTIINASKRELTQQEAKQIKGGDYARLVLVAYGYEGGESGEGGVGFALNLVQFIKEGESLGGGKAAAIAMVDEIEVEADDLDEEDIEDDDDIDDVPKKKGKKVVEEDDDEEELDETEEEDEDDDEEESVKKKSKKSKPVEDDQEDEDFDFDEDEEEDLPKKKKGKAKKSSDDDDDEF